MHHSGCMAVCTSPDLFFPFVHPLSHFILSLHHQSSPGCPALDWRCSTRKSRLCQEWKGPPMVSLRPRSAPRSAISRALLPMLSLPVEPASPTSPAPLASARSARRVWKNASSISSAATASLPSRATTRSRVPCHSPNASVSSSNQTRPAPLLCESEGAPGAAATFVCLSRKSRAAKTEARRHSTFGPFGVRCAH